MFSDTNTDGIAENSMVKYVVGASVLAIILAAVLATSGAAASTEIANKTVTVDNDTQSVYADVTFATINESDMNETADATLEVMNENGTVVVNQTVSGTNETVATTWDPDNDLEGTGDYTIAISTANESNVESTEIGVVQKVAAGGGGGLGGTTIAGVGLPVIALVLAVGWFVTKED